MLDSAALKDLLHERKRTQKEKLLLVLAADAAVPKPTNAIRSIAVANGIRAAKSWNPSAILGGSRTDAILTPSGWELTADGRARVAVMAGNARALTPTTAPAAALRAHIAKVSDPPTAAFLNEAVSCLEAGHLRAAVVLSWVGAVAVLYGHVVAHALVPFNAEAGRRDPRWKTAKTADDLARMKEHEFLDVLEALSILGKSVKAELQHCLTLRNGCGHPNSLRIGASRVASHIEALLLNVFTRF